ncbi:MAG: hypothetical protein AAF891_00165 [Pseudomonadota bacterium]
MTRLALFLLLVASSAPASTLNGFVSQADDPEAMWMEWDLETGRVLFRKPGDYLGEKLGLRETCAWTVGGLDPHFECLPPSGGVSIATASHATAWASATRKDAVRTHLLSAAKWAAKTTSWRKHQEPWEPVKIGGPIFWSGSGPRVDAQHPEGWSSDQPALNPIPLPSSLIMLLTAWFGLFLRSCK